MSYALSRRQRFEQNPTRFSDWIASVRCGLCKTKKMPEAASVVEHMSGDKHKYKVKQLLERGCALFTSCVRCGFTHPLLNDRDVCDMHPKELMGLLLQAHGGMCSGHCEFEMWIYDPEKPCIIAAQGSNDGGSDMGNLTDADSEPDAACAERSVDCGCCSGGCPAVCTHATAGASECVRA